jgi:hypothetical protein
LTASALHAPTKVQPRSATNPNLSSQQPPHPLALEPTSPLPVAPTQPSRSNSRLRRGLGGAPDSFLRTPFRTRGAAQPFQHLSAARLWNPTNSTPRNLAPPTSRPRRLSTPPPPPVPLARPTLDVTEDPSDPTGTAAGDYPLLTLPVEHQVRPSLSNRASLHLDRYAGAEQRISLPPSLRHSYDGTRASHTPSPVEEPEEGPPTSLQAAHLAVPEARRFRSRGLSFKRLQAPIGLSFRPISRDKQDKGKGKAVMAAPEDAGDGLARLV